VSTTLGPPVNQFMDGRPIGLLGRLNAGSTAKVHLLGRRVWCRRFAGIGWLETGKSPLSALV
jgi:hypothetical protein